MAGAIVGIALLAGAGYWMSARGGARPALPGAATPRTAEAPPVSGLRSPVVSPAPAAEAALKDAGKALGKGNLGAAEASYRAARRAALKASTPEARKQAAEAAYGLGYVKAFRKDFKTARTLFRTARSEAGAPKPEEPKGPQVNPESPLNERAAYQEAVCVAASQGKEAGTAAFEAFMERYPYSTLIHGAVQRIRLLNDREWTPRTEKLWNRAQALQRERDRKERTAASMCGPQCLADLLERFGIHATVEELAREAGTNEEGTSMEALAQAARKRGLSAVGLKVTREALAKETLPTIALAGRHFVLIERVTRRGVAVRDPRPAARDERLETRDPRPETREVPWEEWEREWAGVILRVQARGASEA